MVSKTFQGDYGAAVAPADSSPALAAWLVEAAANDGSTLTIEPGSYHWASTNGPTNGLTNATINGYGASVDALFIGNAGLVQENYTQSARIATVLAGASSVTVIAPSGIDSLPPPADVTLFSVGDWIMIAGLSLQTPNGYPPNFQWNEFRKISGIAGSVISFLEPLANTYRSTWPVIDAAHVNSVDLAGPATIYRCLPRFEGTQIYRGLNCTSSITFCSGGKSLLVEDMSWTGGAMGPAPSMGKSIIIRNCQIGTQNEVDKCVEYLEYVGCTGTGVAQLLLQSPLGGSMVVRNCNLVTMNGTARICEIINSTFTGEIILGPVQFGAGSSIRLTNVNYGTLRQFGAVDPALIPTDYTFSGGTFTVPNGSAAQTWRGAIPGENYVFAKYNGGFNITPDVGPPVRFIITDVRQDATNTYIDTNIVGALPTPTYSGGNPPNAYLAEFELTEVETGSANNIGVLFGSGPTITTQGTVTGY